MNEMISYLKDYREEIPAWLSDYFQGKQFSFKDIMSSRVGDAYKCYIPEDMMPEE